jgi:hypothetical protein
MGAVAGRIRRATAMNGFAAKQLTYSQRPATEQYNGKADCKNFHCH